MTVAIAWTSDPIALFSEQKLIFVNGNRHGRSGRCIQVGSALHAGQGMEGEGILHGPSPNTFSFTNALASVAITSPVTSIRKIVSPAALSRDFP